MRTASFLRRAIGLAIVVLAFVPGDASAWTGEHAREISYEGARLAPPDLYRQLVRNRDAFGVGVAEAGRTTHGEFLENNDDGSGRLGALLKQRVDEAVESIRQHRPFNEVAYRVGIVSYLVARANDPLATARSDREESRFGPDYHRYLASAAPRVRRIFYGFRPGRTDAPPSLDSVLDETFARGRSLYPLIGMEYRRIAFAPGVGTFDDRSTAYAVAALSLNHAISDVAEILRYIWLAAGGADTRRGLPVRGRRILHYDGS